MSKHVKFNDDARTPSFTLSFAPFEKIGNRPLPKYDKPTPAPGYRGPRAKIPDRINTLGDWVKWLPGRRWNPKTKTWTVTAGGPDFLQTLSNLGFDTIQIDPTRVQELHQPLVELEDSDPWLTRVYPRLGNPRHLEQSLPAFWHFDKDSYLVRTADLARGYHRLPVPQEVINVGTWQSQTVPANWNVTDSAYFSYLALAPSQLPQASYMPLYEGPRTLFGFQDSGAKAIVGGHSVLTDDPGLGKTVQAITSALTVGAQRVLCVVPPVSLSNWEKEFRIAGYEGEVQIIRPGRKVRPFPETGVLITTDSLLAARPQLAQDIINWGPDFGIHDEAHRSRTFMSERTRAVSRVFHTISGIKVPTTGTPVIKNPTDLIPILDQSGHLEPVFGGASRFLADYFKFNKWRGWEPNLETLPRLRTMLDTYVWVHRKKADVLPDLPEVMRSAEVVDVDLKPYREAHKEVVGIVNHWLDELVEEGNYPPEKDAVQDWARGSGQLVSYLRMAAGRAKIPAAIDWIRERVENQRPANGGTWDDPIVVWTHHNEVTEAMLEACQELNAPVRAIWGKGNSKDTPKTVEDFQTGNVAVLVGSITAAGVAITLTRSARALFVETDWLPSMIQQATDRINRIGQERKMEVVTMVAPGTLDERIQEVQSQAAPVLNTILGGNNDVSVSADGFEQGSTTAVITEIVEKEVARRGGRR